MKGIFGKPLWLLFVCTIASQGFCADLIGKWTGKMSLDGTALKKQLREQSLKLTGDKKKAVENRIKVIDESIQVVDKTKIKMDLKKGGVAFIEFNRGGQALPEWCKWAVKGKKLALTGFTGGGDSTMSLDGVITDNGKTITFDMSSVIQRQMSSQGLKSASKPKMTLTFKKS